MRTAGIGLAILFPLVLAAALMGCTGYYGYGGGYYYPPPWEVGEGAYFHYDYYPDIHVYYDRDRHHYFYRHNGHWQREPRLPDNMRLHGGHVRLRMREGEPYRWHEEIQRRYPSRGEGPRMEAPRREAPEREGGRRR